VLKLALPILLILTLVALSGCQGQAKVTLVGMNLRSVTLQQTDTKVLALHCTRAVHFIDQAGRLNIAAEGRWPSILGRAHSREFYISFLLDKPTAGVGKNYRANRNTVRGYYRQGPHLYRFNSLYGAIAIDNQPQDQLAGAFRITVHLCSSAWLTDWSKPLPFLMFGNFLAKPDTADQGPTILQQTEAKGFTRKHKPLPPIISSQPTFRKHQPTASQPALK